ncbi:MAG: hypothetical protein CVU49_02075 [Candidatus Cloacimonetes bacterium HGW-Cloacimonetes-2]|nr:MAG: hypothetical protein CVU49_02075 [Candidatus Cloacimonetes bacterium HGW-Cloacimonetes-2]
MKSLRIGILIMVMVWIALAQATPLEDFYASLYTARAVQDVEASLGTLLDSDADIDAITEASSVLASFNRGMISEYLQRRYQSEPGNFNVSIAWIYNQEEPTKALRAARRLIMLNRENPEAYHIMVVAYLKWMSALETEDDWAVYDSSLEADAAYFRRYITLAPQSVYANYGKLLSAGEAGDRVRARQAIEALLQAREVIITELNIDALSSKALYRDLFSDYLRAGAQVFADSEEMEAMEQLAVDLAEYMLEHQLWQEIVDTFADQAHYKEIGAVIKGLLLAYETLGRYEDGWSELNAEGLERVVNIIGWWELSNQDQSLDGYLDALIERYSSEMAGRALVLKRTRDLPSKLPMAKEFIELYPSESYGYQALMQAYGEAFMEREFSPSGADSLSASFINDLALWDIFYESDSEAANLALIGMLETFYYGSKFDRVLGIYGFRDFWMELPEVQYLVTNSYFNLGDLEAVMIMLEFMIDNATISISHLRDLESSGNAIIYQEGWDALIERAQSLEQSEAGSE